MKVLRTLPELSDFLGSTKGEPGCLADTGFLYAVAFDDDRLFSKANDVLDILSEFKILIYANVISRLEFVDLIFRKQVTLGCIQLLDTLDDEGLRQPIYKILKDIRDKDTAARKQNQSYKIDEGRLKRLRENIQQVYGLKDWKDFCKKFTGSMLVNEWMILEEELGLNFIEILEGQISDLMPNPLHWKDMVQVMGEHGLRGPDAMIVNLFKKSSLPLLITTP